MSGLDELPADSRVPGQAGALAGVKIVDLSRVLSGPYCTQILADHGADIIKVEPPQGDETRAWGPPFRDGLAAYYEGLNRNKRGIVLDLADDTGRQALLGLLEDADILVENFKPGTLEKWGIGYEDSLSKRFPKLIHCRVSGFGVDGPLGGMPGYDAVLQAMTGIMSVNGERGGNPLRVGVPIVDLGTGLYACIAILMALHERQRSGRGQSIEVSLFDTGLALMHPHLANFMQNRRVPSRSGNSHPNICPYDSFATRGVPIFLAVGNDAQFRRLCSVVGRSELGTDLRFRSNTDRLANADELRRELESLLCNQDGMQLAEELMKAGVPCGPILTVDAVTRHPHAQHRGMLVEIGGYRGTGSPIKMSRSLASYRLPPPRFGEHTREILGGEGGDRADRRE
jgi:crotonobetainyl-CoA:carnitine CoA-transferase CaiB-like acyl-CoA transferase